MNKISSRIFLAASHCQAGNQATKRLFHSVMSQQRVLLAQRRLTQYSFNPYQASFGFAKKTEKDKKAEKKQQEKEQVHAQFEGKDVDTVKKEFDEQLSETIVTLDASLKAIRSGRASPNIFDHIEVVAYGEKHPFTDMCQTIVKGTNNLLVRVFDENVKDDVIKALQRVQDMDLNVTVEGKDLKVKLGTSKKEHTDAALKQVKAAHDEFKREVKDVRHEMQDSVKKLDKILPQDDCKLMQKDLEKLVTNREAEAKKLVDAKEKEIKGA